MLKQVFKKNGFLNNISLTIIDVFTGVMSALRHDSIVDAGNPDYALVEGEAERVAKEAVIFITCVVYLKEMYHVNSSFLDKRTEELAP